MLAHSQYTFFFALLELLDNAISKGSTYSRIRLWQSSKKFLEALCIIDDGCGMTIEDLCHAWIIGRAKDRDAGDIGKFHVGMKSAIINIGKRCVILSKAPGGPIVGLYADITLMKKENSFNPTALCENVTEEWVSTFMPRDLFRVLQSQASGTLIWVGDMLPSCQFDGEPAKVSLIKDIANTYSTIPNNCALSVQLDDEAETRVVLRDLFYKGTEATHLEEPPYETTLYAYKGRDERSPMRYIERITQPRELPKSHPMYQLVKNASVAHPVFCEYVGTLVRGKGKRPTSGENMSHLAEVPLEAPIGQLDLRLVCVNAATDEEEDNTLNGNLQVDRKGFHFLRDGVRTVGSAKHIGQKIHDRQSTTQERLRMLVTFPNELDDQVGSAFNKQMGNEALPSAILTDALFTVYAQGSAPWVTKGKAAAAAAAAAKREAEEAASTTTMGPSMGFPTHNAVVMGTVRTPTTAEPSALASALALAMRSSPEAPIAAAAAAAAAPAPSVASISPLPASRSPSPSDSSDPEEPAEANELEPPSLVSDSATVSEPSLTLVAAPVASSRGLVNGYYISVAEGLRIPIANPNLTFVEWMNGQDESVLLALAVLFRA